MWNKIVIAIQLWQREREKLVGKSQYNSEMDEAFKSLAHENTLECWCIILEPVDVRLALPIKNL